MWARVAREEQKMALEEIQKKVERDLQGSTKSQALDGFLYNGGVVFTLCCTESQPSSAQ